MGAKDGSRRGRWLVLGLLVLGFAFLAIGVACHVGNEHGHLGSVHGQPPGEGSERWCVKKESSGLDLYDMEISIDRALRANGHQNDWEAVSGLHFVRMGDCDEIDDFFVLNSIDIKFRLVSQGPLECLYGSCVWPPIPGDLMYQHHGHNNARRTAGAPPPETPERGSGSGSSTGNDA